MLDVVCLGPSFKLEGGWGWGERKWPRFRTRRKTAEWARRPAPQLIVILLGGQTADDKVHPVLWGEAV